jgi:hypothetical protein
VDAFQLRLQVMGSPIPSPLLIGMPYLLTIVVVTLAATRSGYPAAINTPYLARRSGPSSRTAMARHPSTQSSKQARLEPLTGRATDESFDFRRNRIAVPVKTADRR